MLAEQSGKSRFPFGRAGAADDPAVIARVFKRQFQTMIRQDTCRPGRPFDHRQPGQGKVLIEAEIKDLRGIVQTVKIHVIEGNAAGILMENGKGGAGDIFGIRDLQALSDSLRQSCFPRPEVAVEADHVAGKCQLPQFTSEQSCFVKIFQIDTDLSAHVDYVITFVHRGPLTACCRFHKKTRPAGWLSVGL